MPKPPLNERIKALEDQNRLLLDKIDRMKAQVKHNREVIKKYQKREDKQDVEALINQVQAERHRRSEQSQRDKKRNRANAVVKFDQVGKKLHPTQKPVKLVEYLIRTYTENDALVLDNCMGSGTTAVAAIKSGRHYIGFETNKEYFDIAQGRINDVLRNPTLF